MIAEDIAKGVLLDVAVERAGDICIAGDAALMDDVGTKAALGRPDFHGFPAGPELDGDLHQIPVVKAAAHWPGWERDLGLVGAFKNLIGQAFHDAETRGSELRKKAATGGMYASNATLRDLISDEVREVFSGVLTPLWTEAWNLGYASAKSRSPGSPPTSAPNMKVRRWPGSLALRGSTGFSRSPGPGSATTPHGQN